MNQEVLEREAFELVHAFYSLSQENKKAVIPFLERINAGEDPDIVINDFGQFVKSRRNTANEKSITHV